MKINKGTKIPVFITVWKIKNFSHCWHDGNNHLDSASFTIDSLRGTTWSLSLSFRGKRWNEKKLCVYLKRCDYLRQRIIIDFNFTLLATDGSRRQLHQITNHQFKNSHACGIQDFMDCEELFTNQSATLLPFDTLTLQCCIWYKKASPKKFAQCFLSTEIEIQQSSFIWSIKKFSSYSNEALKLSTCVRFPSKGRDLSYMKFRLIEDYSRDNNIHIAVFKKYDYPCITKCKISMLGANGTIIISMQEKYLFAYENEFWKIPFFFKKSKLLENKDLYLPNDKLTLQCDFAISDGVVLNKIEKFIYGLSSTQTKNLMMETAKQYTAVKTTASKSSDLHLSSNSLKNDLLCLYEEGKLCDFALQVGNELLYVHKAVLCARSPVFKTMLTSDMNETINQVIAVPDLDIDIVHRMLIFMYTDTTSNLEWETANKLYAAADHYGIVDLKRICSNFLKSSLCIANVGEILLLADLHADEDLKNLAWDFIYYNDKEVICSTEWEAFMQKDVQLAAEIMHLIFLRKTKSIHSKKKALSETH